jgi:hypothetical protein
MRMHETPPDILGRRKDIPPLQESRHARERLLRSSPVSTDIRRQLEGGIETLETAHARYALLEKALRTRRWQQKTLRRLDTLRRLVREEPRIVEALARLHQRAQAEEWPETEPALGLARKVERLRSRLEALPRKHFNGPAHWKPRLVEGLAFIDQRLTRTIAAPVSEEEQLLHQGAILPMFRLPRLLMVLGFFASIHFIGFYIISSSLPRGGIQFSGFPWRVYLYMMSMYVLTWYALVNVSEAIRISAPWGVLPGGKPLLWRPPRWSEPIGRHLFALYIRAQLCFPMKMRWVDGHYRLVLRDDENPERFAARVSQWPARKVWSIPVKLLAILFCLPEILYLELHGRFSGRYWLTNKRLVWRPPWRSPIHIPLQAIRTGGIFRLSRRKVAVSLVDGRQMRLGPLDEEDADRLIRLLHQRCPDWRWEPGEANSFDPDALRSSQF